MGITVRVYPQPHSIGARRNRAAKRQQFRFIQQQRLFQAQQLRLQQQALIQAQQGARFSGYGSYWNQGSYNPNVIDGVYGNPFQTSPFGSPYGAPFVPAYLGGSLVTPGVSMYPGGITTSTQQIGYAQGGYTGQYAYPC